MHVVPSCNHFEHLSTSAFLLYHSTDTCSLEHAASKKQIEIMGINLSSEKLSKMAADEYEQLQRAQLQMSKPISVAEKLVVNFWLYSFQPMLDYYQLQSMLISSLGTKDPELVSQLIEASWTVFEENGVCQTYEVISCIVLLSDGNWKSRCSLLYDLFRCMGTDDIGYEDVIVAAQTVSFSFAKVCGVEPWSASIMTTHSEGLAEGVYTKFDKEVEDDLQKHQFLDWAMDRFRENRVITNYDDLLKIYASPFE